VRVREGLLEMDRICPLCRQATDASECPDDGTPTVPRDEYGRRSKVAKVDRLLGTTFQGRYRIEAKLGQGGMGAVYRATQLAVGRQVAVKVIHAALADNEKEVARFQQEARAIASLHHPNIISLIDFGQSDEGDLFLVMEFVEGEPLSAIARREAPLDPRRVARLGSQIMDALSVAHDKGIVHRDMKPENLFITHVGRRGEFVKVLDFGIAKMEGDGGAEMTLTRTGAIIGSPRYMAPEQARGLPISGQTDIYAVGAILYELLTGGPVFDAKSATDYVIAHVTKPPPPPVADGRRLAGPLVDLILWMLAKDPADRPQGAEAVLRALDACAERPVLDPTDPAQIDTGTLTSPAGMDETREQPPPTLLPGPQELATQPAVVPSLGGGGAQPSPGVPTPGLETVPASSAAPPPLARTSGRKGWALGVAALVAAAVAVAAWVATRPAPHPAPAARVVTSPPVAPQPRAEAAPTPAPATPAPTHEVTTGAATAPDAALAEPTHEPDAGPAAAQAPPDAASPQDAQGAPPPDAAKPTAAPSPTPVVTHVLTRPAGAHVFLAGRDLGAAPVDVTWPPGARELKLRVAAPKGYLAAGRTLEAGEQGETVTVTLRRRAAPKAHAKPKAKQSPKPKPKRKSKYRMLE